MLARVAERVYWMGRYIERAESTARLVNAYTTQMMDLPKAAEHGWKGLVDIVGANPAFDASYTTYDEKSTTAFLIADADHPGSILSSLAMARENVRTARDVLPTEAWACANELYLHARTHAGEAIGRKHRFSFLNAVIFRCQQITGLLAGTMSRDAAYEFVRIGRNLERADMTTRIIDSAAFILLPRKATPGEYDNILWVNVLKSLSAYQMYRRHVRNRLVADEVIRYLLKDRVFPRAVAHTLAEGREGLASLRHNGGPLLSLARAQARTDAADVAALSLDGLHRLIDEVQADLGDLHRQIAATWFARERPVQVQAQSA